MRMYWIPILIVAAVCVIGVAWSPIFAVIIAIPALIAFFLFIGLSPRSDEVHPGTPDQEAAASDEPTSTKGIWGERQPS